VQVERRLDDIAADFPDMTIIGAHPSWPWQDEALAVCRHKTNYYIDLSGWARDAIALALPDKILCRPDCAGLCDVCGKNLNDEPHTHEEEHGDPRWAALEALREQSS